MKNLMHFDVLVVYSAYAAQSVRSKRRGNRSPFALSGSRSDYDNSYSYLLKVCGEMNLSAAFTTSADITAAGTCRAYWLFENDVWIKVDEYAKATVVFDKFSPFNERQKKQRDLMFSCRRIQPFNEAGLYQLFFNKLSTYKYLPDVSIPTVAISSSSSVRSALSKLRTIVANHRHPNDFTGEYILKNRFGSAGNHVYHIKDVNSGRMEKILSQFKKVQFILQPMVKFDDGYSYREHRGKIEIRLIFMGDKVVQTYIRVAPKGGHLCNDHQGGKSLYIKMSDVPERVLNKAYAVVERLPSHDSLYALDFLVSNDGNPYLLEGNTGPGLNWNPKDRTEEKKSHELIDLIVRELKRRVVRHRSSAGYCQTSTSAVYS